jgi:hypothetical protein
MSADFFKRIYQFLSKKKVSQSAILYVLEQLILTLPPINSRVKQTYRNHTEAIAICEWRGRSSYTSMLFLFG